MNRRLFFKNLIGASAAAALGPKMLNAISDHEYEPTPGKPISTPHKVFHNEEGLWVLRNTDELVAWSAIPGISFHWERPIIDVTPDPRFSPKPVLYREYIGGCPEFWWTIENLHILDTTIFNMEYLLDIIVKRPEGTIRSAGYLTEYSILPEAMEIGTVSAKFRGSGEATIEYES